MTAYEVDIDLYSILQKKFKEEIDSRKLQIVLGDVLEKWEDSSSLYGGKYDLIANLPYYIATNIILKAFEDDNCEHIIVMIQKEVADKFTALPKDKEFSSLGVMTQLISKEARTLVVVPPESFDPAPKVDSAVIYIKKDMQTKLSDGFKRFLKTCFISPRKKLIKNLSSAYDKKMLEKIFEEFNISLSLRPHEVDASLYSQIYTKVTNGRDNKGNAS
jgi:16S rRNA (adenine1518-N6/adenine1519-N6)-dimethyltransferase